MNLKELFRRKADYMNWSEYKRKINMLDDFCWRQSVRRKNIQLM